MQYYIYRAAVNCDRKSWKQAGGKKYNGKCRVPIIPGGKNPIYTVEEGMKEAETIGYPVIIKAALGGGGKGMRVADTPADFEESFRTAQKETQMAFGDSTMYVEHLYVIQDILNFRSCR